MQCHNIAFNDRLSHHHFIQLSHHRMFFFAHVPYIITFFATEMFINHFDPSRGGSCYDRLDAKIMFNNFNKSAFPIETTARRYKKDTNFPFNFYHPALIISIWNFAFQAKLVTTNNQKKNRNTPLMKKNVVSSCDKAKSFST